MVTRTQVNRLSQLIDQIAEKARNRAPVEVVVVNVGESKEDAIARHRANNPVAAELTVCLQRFCLIETGVPRGTDSIAGRAGHGNGDADQEAH